MLRRKIAVLCLFTLLFSTGCGENTRQETEKIQTEDAGENREQEISDESVKLAEGYRSAYESAERNGQLDSLELKCEITEYLGDAGYAAVDMADLTNMVNYEQAEAFCESAEAGEENHVTIFAVMDKGAFVRYDMETQNGGIDVAVSSLRWEDGSPRVYYYNEFTAHSWKYTEKGYLFIEEYRPPGYDGAPGEIAFRVKPLDETCRELNLRYVNPVGYKLNNLLITDWDEQDFSDLNFYDLYDKLYYIKYGEYVPYEPYEGAEYDIPAQEFEQVIQGYFRISREQLAEKTIYDPENETYCYRLRGYHENELPYGPYPEVTAWKKQADGTIRLTVEAVWERRMTDQAGASELVVRPLGDGSFQYVSNRVTAYDESLKLPWHTPRLTDEEWQSYYGSGAGSSGDE